MMENRKVSEKILCRNQTKDALANALVKIYKGADCKEIIESMCRESKYSRVKSC